MKTPIRTLTKIVSRAALRIPLGLCLALLVMLGLAARPAAAAIAVVDATGGIVTNNVTTVNVPFNTTGGNVLVVNFQWRGSNSSIPLTNPPVALDWVVAGVTQNMTRAVAVCFSNVARAYVSSVYYCTNATSEPAPSGVVFHHPIRSS